MSKPGQNPATKIREPLFHVTARADMPWWQSLLIRVAAVAFALLVCGLVSFLLIGETPLKLYSTIISGTVGTPRKLWKLLKDLAILLCISLAVTPAFRMKFWNIGAEGQTLIGSLASVGVVLYLGDRLPNNLLLVVMFLASVVAGAIWGVIPAIFKVKWNTNETLFTLMMNYVATALVAFCIVKWVPSGSNSIPEQSAGHFPSIGPAEWQNFIRAYLPLVIIALLLAVAMYVYLRYTKHGYEISVVGESQRTAKYIGINVPKVIIRTMILSGALCGVVGFLLVSALNHSVTTESVGGQGFTAIMVSWLAKFNPFIMIGTSFIMVFLNQGAAQMATDFGTSSAFPSVITGIILFFIIGCEFFIRYRINFRHFGKRSPKNAEIQTGKGDESCRS